MDCINPKELFDKPKENPTDEMNNPQDSKTVNPFDFYFYHDGSKVVKRNFNQKTPVNILPIEIDEYFAVLEFYEKWTSNNIWPTRYDEMQFLAEFFVSRFEKYQNRNLFSLDNQSFKAFGGLVIYDIPKLVAYKSSIDEDIEQCGISIENGSVENFLLHNNVATFLDQNNPLFKQLSSDNFRYLMIPAYEAYKIISKQDTASVVLKEFNDKLDYLKMCLQHDEQSGKCNTEYSRQIKYLSQFEFSITFNTEVMRPLNEANTVKDGRSEKRDLNARETYILLKYMMKDHIIDNNYFKETPFKKLVAGISGFSVDTLETARKEHQKDQWGYTAEKFDSSRNKIKELMEAFIPDNYESLSQVKREHYGRIKSIIAKLSL